MAILILIAGLLLFFIPHILKATPLRNTLVTRLSEKSYKARIVPIMGVGFILIIIGKAKAPFIHIWPALPQLRHLTMMLMWISFVFLAASGKASNLKRVTRHPMLWGIVIWSSGHLLVNGDLASMLLFGSFWAYSLFAMVVQTRRGAQKSSEVVAMKSDIGLMIGATAFYLLVFFMHGILFGIPLR